MTEDPNDEDRKQAERRSERREQVEAWLRGDLSRKPKPIADRPHRDDYGIALTFGVTLVVFVLGGVGLDSWLGTSPVFVLVLAGVGLFGGFVHLVESVSPGTLFPGRKGLRPKKPPEEGKKEEEKP